MKAIVRREYPATMNKDPDTLMVANVGGLGAEVHLDLGVFAQDGLGYRIGEQPNPVVLRLGDRIVVEVVS